MIIACSAMGMVLCPKDIYREKIMRRSLTMLFLLGFWVILGAGIITVPVSQEAAGVEITNQSDNGLSLSVNIGEIKIYSVNTPAGEFINLSIEGYSNTTQAGSPRLPRVRKIIWVPLGAEVSVNAKAGEESIISLSDYGVTNKIMPSQPPLSKGISPEEVEFIYNPAAYRENSYIRSELVMVEELGILRGLRLFVIDIEPLGYNPVSNEILVWNDLEIEVEFSGANHEATAQLRSRTWSPVYEPVFRQSIINYQRLKDREDLTRYPISYLIISDSMFEEQLGEFINWKIRKGYNITVAYTDDIGSTTGAIQTYIQGIWDEATPEEPAPSFVLFVGDTAQIPAYNGTQGNHVTDLNYLRLEGADFMPEIYYGRFSAQNAAQLQPQIDKTIEYEMYSMADPSYLEEVVMIAGMDASHGANWGNGQINYGTTNYFNEDHGITSHTYLYPASGSNAENIIQNVSEGVSYINYTAHGNVDSWSDPGFTINNINSLQNEGKYCFAVGNCCLTNKFEIGTCFGEAWLRAENKGAIGYIGGTNSTYWDEDFWWGVGAGTIQSNPTYEGTGPGAYDGMWHDHGEGFDQWYTTGFGYIMAGNLAVVEGGSGMINYYWEIYALMGDPSLSVYFGVPQANTVTYPAELLLGLDTMEIYADPYSYVALTYNDQIKGVGLIDESGFLALEYDVFEEPCLASLVITGQNRIPLLAEIQVIPNEGAYLILDGYEVISGDDNQINGGETAQISIDLENVGIEDAQDTFLMITCDNEYINLAENEIELGIIPAQSTVHYADLIVFEIHEEIPFGYPLSMLLEFSTAQEIWHAEINLVAYAPPGLWITAESIDIELDTLDIYQTGFSISNYLEEPVTYSIRAESSEPGRELTGSFVECSHNHFEPGESYQWIVTAYNQSSDGEWVTDVSVSFPEGVIVENTGLMTGGTGGNLVPDITGGNGITITWHGATSSGYGYLHAMQSAQAVVLVTIEETYTGYINCDYNITGDGYGNEPHEVSGSFELSYPLSWISLSNSSGELNYGETAIIDILINPAGLDLGEYTCDIVITDSRIETIIPVSVLIAGFMEENNAEIDNIAGLKGNYPNPFNPETKILFELKESAPVQLEIYNIKGQKVISLIDEYKSSGSHSAYWDGKDAGGSEVVSGIYLYRLRVQDSIYMRKMMLMK
jgi:hypothetical protein